MNLSGFHLIFSLLCSVSINGASEEKPCFEELGCFSNDVPWISFGRPSFFLPLPADPSAIDTKIFYFSRDVNTTVEIQLWPNISLSDKLFYSKRERTVFITHGFIEHGLLEWMIEMKDAILNRMDANVFLVDWKHGARTMNYFQATSNTRVVGAEIGRFMTHLVIHKQQNPSKLYLIGHSLGAHIMAYAANYLEEKAGKVGRITGLDPAQPCFEMEDNIVKLDSTDANFVDIVHTNAQPTIPLLGFGIMEPIGHVDFYVNGGSVQPNCIARALTLKIPNLSALGNLALEELKKHTFCSHDLARHYFASALNHSNCGFTGRKISEYERLILLVAHGGLKLITNPILQPCAKNEPCSIMGLEAEDIPVRGSFAVIANSTPPYCDSSEYFRMMKRILLKHS